MKKYLIVSIIFLCIFAISITLSYAGTILLKNVTATGAGLPVIVADQDTHTVECYFTTTGSVTALTVALEGIIDSSHWETLASHVFSGAELTAKQTMFHVVGKKVNRVRANITTLAETGTTAITVYYK